MNIYFVGMCISMAIYIIIGIVVSRKVKDANDYYVAGRRAPVILIAGSLVASYASTGVFMGDAAQCYDGAFTSIMLAGLQSAGYILGGVFFGRYLRRSGAMTIPEFFGNRFASTAMRKLAAITAITMMAVYLLSVIQGIGTLMNAVTGIDYNICIIIALVVFTIITVIAGSTGVLITDTLMATLFTSALIISAVVIASKMGGWSNAIGSVAANPDTREYLSWAGKPGVLYNTGVENVIWGINYGIVWTSVCAIGPWQSSRYMMAKDEQTIIKSAPFAAIGVFLLQFIVGLVSVMINNVNYMMEGSSRVLIWASMNMLPLVLGVILLTGVLGAGISSATTFLSLIGASFANDVFYAHGKKSINIGRIAMVIVSAIVLSVALLNPPSIFWIMFLGGAMAASSWMPVAFASVFSKRLTKTGAFAGMLAGFLGCFALRLYISLAGITLPVYLEPSMIGIIFNIIAMVIGSALTQVSPEEKAEREKLFVLPKSERSVSSIQSILKWSKASYLVGVIVFVLMMALWVVPYLRGLA